MSQQGQIGLQQRAQSHYRDKKSCDRSARAYSSSRSTNTGVGGMWWWRNRRSCAVATACGWKDEGGRRIDDRDVEVFGKCLGGGARARPQSASKPLLRMLSRCSAQGAWREASGLRALLLRSRSCQMLPDVSCVEVEFS
jgi:hypothetical protein